MEVDRRRQVWARPRHHQHPRFNELCGTGSRTTPGGKDHISRGRADTWVCNGWPVISCRPSKYSLIVGEGLPPLPTHTRPLHLSTGEARRAHHGAPPSYQLSAGWGNHVSSMASPAITPGAQPGHQPVIMWHSYHGTTNIVKPLHVFKHYKKAE